MVCQGMSNTLAWNPPPPQPVQQCSMYFVAVHGTSTPWN